MNKIEDSQAVEFESITLLMLSLSAVSQTLKKMSKQVNQMQEMHEQVSPPLFIRSPFLCSFGFTFLFDSLQFPE